MGWPWGAWELGYRLRSLPLFVTGPPCQHSLLYPQVTAVRENKAVQHQNTMNCDFCATLARRSLQFISMCMNGTDVSTSISAYSFLPLHSAWPWELGAEAMELESWFCHC